MFGLSLLISGPGFFRRTNPNPGEGLSFLLTGLQIRTAEAQRSKLTVLKIPSDGNGVNLFFHSGGTAVTENGNVPVTP